MRYSFQLAQILAQHGYRVHGMISRIAQQTKLERHKVSALMKGTARTVSLDTLGALCGFLVDLGVDERELPGALFARQPETFWENIRASGVVQICLGIRGIDREPEHRMANGADTKLLGELVRDIVGHAGSQPRLEQTVVPSYEHETKPASRKRDYKEAISKGRKAYREFEQRRDPCTLLCIGSQKALPLTEMVISKCFRVPPFVPPTATSLADLQCPFFLQYREADAQVPSCAGGLQTPGRKRWEAGILYEDDHGKWTSCPCTPHRDAALVFYWFDDSLQRRQVIMGGFSARSTMSLADGLRSIVDEIQTRTEEEKDLTVKIGAARYAAFVVQFRYPDATAEQFSGRDVLPISRALRRRLTKASKGA